LPFNVNRIKGQRLFRGCRLAIAVIGLTACTKSSTPASPDHAGSLIGTWTGTILSAAIGAGTATMVVDFQIPTPTVPLFSGTFALVFPDQTFNAKGAMSGNVDPGGTSVTLLFDRSTVPCPVEPGGSSQKVVAANATLTNNRMRGEYIVGGCPGGTLDLMRQP